MARESDSSLGGAQRIGVMPEGPPPKAMIFVMGLVERFKTRFSRGR